MARPKHRTRPGATYFVTTDTWQRRALFQNPGPASIVEEAIFYYRDQGSFRVHRYVVMPDHLHIVLTPGETTTLEKAVQLIKGGSSHKIGKHPGCVFLFGALGSRNTKYKISAISIHTQTTSTRIR